MSAEAVAGAVLVGADVVALVVLPGAFRAVFSPPLRPVGVGVLVVVTGLWLWLALVRGPGWFVVAFCVDLGVSVVHTVLALLVRRVRPLVTEPLRLSHFVQESARFDGPQSIGLLVGHTGAVFVFVAQPRLRQFSATLSGSVCLFCFVEDQVRRLVGEDAPVVAEYRGHLGAGGNRHVILRRGSSDAPWQVRLADRKAYRRVRPAPTCPVHGPLTAHGRPGPPAGP
ncbi:hypothetical protein AB0O91_28025 [Kitasatospora sp. NPDC089797]|uniref:hypothetical protein n=1 Tax=Kitasatospora sp. NPDC089797 TaxID=3155298 RepID=UPI00342A6BAB